MLYLRPKGFTCVRCGELAYQSQREGAMAQAQRGRRKALDRLQVDGSKPKGMHWTTYERLVQRIDSRAK